MKLPEVLPRRLETLYHRLRLNAGLTKTYLFRLGVTTNPYCDNCGSPETVQHLLLECPAYVRERCLLAQKIERFNSEPVTLKILIGLWPSPSAQRKAQAAFFEYLEEIGVIDMI